MHTGCVRPGTHWVRQAGCTSRYTLGASGSRVHFRSGCTRLKVHNRYIQTGCINQAASAHQVHQAGCVTSAFRPVVYGGTSDLERTYTYWVHQTESAHQTQQAWCTLGASSSVRKLSCKPGAHTGGTSDCASRVLFSHTDSMCNALGGVRQVPVLLHCTQHYSVW